MSTEAIERRVDFLGIPVKKTSCGAKYKEELSHPPIFPRSQSMEKKYVYVAATPSGAVEVIKGVYMNEYVQETSPETWEEDSPRMPSLCSEDFKFHWEKNVPITERIIHCEGKDIKKHAKGPRRWNGTRISLRLAAAK